jgi:class 3 adenylate cyclase
MAAVEPMATKPAVQPERPVGYGALLLFGSVTLWVYTAFHFCRLLRAHAAARLASGSVPASDPLLRTLRYARVHAVVAGLTVAVLVAGEAIYELTNALGPVPWLTVLASAAFAASTIALLVGLFRGIRRHEALELEQLQAQGGTVAPAALERRNGEWNAQESWLTLTAIVSVACIASPAFAVLQLARLPTLDDARGLMLSDRWATAVICAGGLFHALGTTFLVRLVNAHFAWEGRIARGAAAAAAAERPIALKAILFTDISGYSRLMEADEAAALRLLEVHNAIVREAIDAHGGHEIKTIGDAFLVVFDSAVEAVRCAVALQRGLHARNRRVPGETPVLVRAGVHVGDVTLADGDVLGDNVNLAARLESVAEPGGICVSDQVRQAVCRRLSLPFVPLGPVPLKNLAHSPDLFAIPRAYLDGEE